jgi:hypothetical protein
MSPLTLTVSSSPVSAYAPDSSEGEEGRSIHESLFRAFGFDRSIVRGYRVREALSQLNLVVEEASTPNWDGYGGRAIVPGAESRAELFLRSLPTWVDVPEVSAHPDGEIGIEWYHGPTRVLTVSLGTEDVATYAVLSGIERAHGRAVFTGTVPSIVLFHLRRLGARG